MSHLLFHDYSSWQHSLPPHGLLSALVSLLDCLCRTLVKQSMLRGERNEKKKQPRKKKGIRSWQLNKSVTYPSWFSTTALVLWNHPDRQHLLRQLPCRQLLSSSLFRYLLCQLLFFSKLVAWVLHFKLGYCGCLKKDTIFHMQNR